VSAEIIASDVSLLVTFNHAIDSVIQNNEGKGQSESVGHLKRDFSSKLIRSLSRGGFRIVGEDLAI